MMRHRFGRVLIPMTLATSLAAAAATFPGCGGAGQLQTYHTTGKVHFADGTPLPGGSVVFQSVEHRLTANAPIQEDGTFQLGTYEPGDGAVAGKHTAAVQPPMTNPDMGPRVPIHPRFRRMETSGLEFTVTEEGPNEFDILVEAPAAGAARPAIDID